MSYTPITPGGEPSSGPNLAGCLLWFIGGISLSFMAILSLVTLALLAASVALNIYLGWRLAGMEIVITQATPIAPQVIIATATPPAQVAIQPADAVGAAPIVPDPALTSGDETPPPTVTATPLPPQVEVETQMGTVAAIATQQAGESDSAAAFVPPSATSPPLAGAVPINPAGPSANPPAASAPADTPAAEVTLPPTPAPPAAPLESANQENQASTDPVEENREQVRRSQAEPAALSSSNSYDLITIEGERESRPAAEHGDLNLKLREPQPIDAAPELVDIDGSGIDPNTPKFNKVFEPKFSTWF